MIKRLFIFSVLLFAVLRASAFSLCQTPADTVAARPGFTSVQVPDSLADLVRDFVSGKVSSISHAEVFIPNEKVLVKGDTVPMVIPERNIGRYHRGLFNYIFIPQKQWQFGITASYAEMASSDLQLMDLLTDFDFSGHTFSIRPYISYFVKNNLSIGVRIAYTSAKGNLNSLALDFDEDLNMDVHDAMYRNEAISTSIFARQYIGLSRQGRFGIFNELELAFASGNSDFRRLFDGKLKLTTTTYSDLHLNFSPGLCVFINDYVSFNIAFAVVGFYLRNEKQSVDGEYSGNRFSSGANFRFNLFNINFGLGVHL